MSQQIPAQKPNELKPKKVVSRSVAVGLGIVCVLLVAGLGGVIAYYTKAINDKNVQYDSYVANHSHNDSEYNALASQNSSLEAQVNSLQAPHMLEVDLRGDNIYLPSQTSYLHIYGYLFNAGILTATDVRLHVVLYSLDAILNQTYVDVGSIGGRTWASVDANVTYDGIFGSNETLILSGWIISPQWASS